MEGQPENGKSRFQAALLVGMMKRFWVEMFANCLRQPEIQNGTATALRQTVEQNGERFHSAKILASRPHAIFRLPFEDNRGGLKPQGSLKPT